MSGVRAAVAGDLDALLDMMEVFNRAERIEFRRETGGPALARLIDDGALGRVLVLTDSSGAELYGYALLTWGFDLEFGGRDAFLTELFVRPEHRRHGGARRLLDELARLARLEGAGAIHLGVYPDNHPALHLYQSAGFIRIPRDYYSKKLV
jgi:ribosomal protein S18 acetylase RimI-like enzyme